MAASYKNIVSSQEDVVHLSDHNEESPPSSSSGYTTMMDAGGVAGDTQNGEKRLKIVLYVLILLCAGLAILSLILILSRSSTSAHLDSCGGENVIKNETADSSQLTLNSKKGFSIPIIYPDARRDLSAWDEYHGIKVPDPYRWLETDSLETRSFIDAQNNLTITLLDFWSTSVLHRSRKSILDRISLTSSKERLDVPVKIGKKYFTESYQLVNGSYKLFYYVQNKLDGENKTILSKAVALPPRGFYINYHALSPNGEMLAYSIASANDLVSDLPVQEIRIRNVSTATTDDWPDVRRSRHRLYRAFEFSKDDKGLFYINQVNKEKRANGSHPIELAVTQILYSRLGQHRFEDDVVVGEFLDDFRQHDAYIQFSGCRQFLLLWRLQRKPRQTSMHLLSLDGIGGIKMRQLVLVFQMEGNATYSYVANDGATFYLKCEEDGSNGKIVRVDARHVLARSDTDEKENGDNHLRPFVLSTVDDFVGENTAGMLAHAIPTDKNKLLLVYQNDSKISLEWRRLKDGSLIKKLETIAVGLVEEVNGDGDSPEFFFLHQNMVSHSTLYHCQFLEKGGAGCSIIKYAAISNTDQKNLVHERLLYPTKSGSLMPIHILRKRNVPLDGNSPLILQEGHFQFVRAWSLSFVSDFDGIYATAQVKGGRMGGFVQSKNNFSHHKDFAQDFQSAAEFLVANNYTKPQKLAIQGGWFVGVCVNRRPDLYGAAIVSSGTLDLLRHHKICPDTYHHCEKFGSPEEDKENFEHLIAQSPLHNIARLAGKNNETVQYPSILVSAPVIQNPRSLNLPESLKYVAQLQHDLGQNGRQKTPFLLLVDQNGGPSIVRETREQAAIYTFLAGTIGLVFNDGNNDNNSISH